MSRRLHHPEARQADLRAKASRTSERLATNAWRWPYGWRILLWDQQGNVHRRDTAVLGSYADAVAIRDEEMASGDYEKAWIQLKTPQDHS